MYSCTTAHDFGFLGRRCDHCSASPI